MGRIRSLARRFASTLAKTLARPFLGEPPVVAADTWAAFATGGLQEDTWANLETTGGNPTTWGDLT